MISNSKIKKEVSCKPLILLVNVVKGYNIDLAEIFNGVPYEQSYLLNKHERIEWEVWCKIISNLRPYFTLNGFEKIGNNCVNKGKYPEAIIASMIWFSSKLGRLISDPIFKILDHGFSCISHKLEYQSQNNVKLTLWLNEGYEFLPEFFMMTKGASEYYGSISGHKGFKTDMAWIEHGAEYNFSWEKREGIISKLIRTLKMLFNIKRTFLELTESHEELLNQYYELDESKKFLQKQTINLQTAYEISKSIRQSQDIKKTLNVITSTLIKNTEFSSACIKLSRDIEGNNLVVEAFSGLSTKNSEKIKRAIIINEEKIGELIVYPKATAELSELEKLLNYLLPIINISIHDSLVLRTVTDYKNNLETKVDKRTAELQKAQEKLSETIHLLQDAQQAQNRFFTNISHEFRTPLTLILGPVKQIIKKVKDEKTKDELRVMQKNANNLLGLVNQLLDISRLESGNMKLQASPQNIIPLLKALLQSFYSYAERKRINLKFNSSKDEIVVYIDKEKIEKIITNILANAFKFTPEGGEIEVTVTRSFSSIGKSHSELVSDYEVDKPSEKKLKQVQLDKCEFVEISVSDTGIGIPKEKIPKIFDRFYQVDGSHKREQVTHPDFIGEGTGIGLALTKELIELHKGMIKVESEEGKGTTFIISIPLGKEHLNHEEIVETNKAELEVTDLTAEEIPIGELKTEKADTIDLIPGEDKPVLLIVEDNSDVRNYIKDNLKEDYRVLEAVNGEDGWNKSVDPAYGGADLIISDVMMPEMDGFELCRKLKTDERTSHIPVIMLTAKASGQDKIEGFETGADEYIMKPFDTDELKARIKNLIEQRKRIHEHFRKHGLIELDEKNITSVDQKFLQKVFDLISQHISDSSFNVELLVENLALSRSVLHRKILSLAGETPGELIRRVRLKKAASLIEQKFGNLSEIALEAGFNNPAYFSECFKKQFGITPSQYQQKFMAN